MEKWSTFTTETNKDTTLNNHRYTHGEELANTLSHGAGILLGIIAGYFLLIKAAAGNDPHWAVACVSVYLAGMLSSYQFYLVSCFRSGNDERIITEI